MGGGEESVTITMVVENGTSFWVAGRLIFSIPACATRFWIAASGGKLSELYCLIRNWIRNHYHPHFWHAFHFRFIRTSERTYMPSGKCIRSIPCTSVFYYTAVLCIVALAD